MDLLLPGHVTGHVTYLQQRGGVSAGGQQADQRQAVRELLQVGQVEVQEVTLGSQVTQVITLILSPDWLRSRSPLAPPW